MGSSGNHDRRGFNTALMASLALVPIGVILVFVNDWFTGLIVSLLGAIAYIACEGASAPPANDSRAFGIWQRRQNRRRPILVCLGDSLTHGTCSSSITPDIPIKLCSKLGMELPKFGSFFSDPLWVVNCGQNFVTSRVIREERLNSALSCYPDYILIWIGTNDVRSIVNSSMGKHSMKVNKLNSVPTMENYAANIRGILDFLEEASPTVKIGLCTLPPLGEDLKSAENKKIREANEILHDAAREYGSNCTIVPVYETMESSLEKTKRGRGFPSFLGLFFSVSVQAILHCHLWFLFSLDTLSSIWGYSLLTDGLHLNDKAGAMVTDCVIDWLVQAGIAKAIAVKS